MSEADDQLLADLIAVDSYYASPRKWTKHTRNNGKGGRCLVGACDFVHARVATCDWMSDRVEGLGGEFRHSGRIGLNDHPRVTFADIKTFLRYCIDYRKWQLATGSGQ